MFRKFFLSDKGSIDVILIVAVGVLCAVILTINVVRPPRTAEDLTLLNSSILSVPASQCEIRGILRKNSPAALVVVDREGRVVDTVPDARVWLATDDRLLILTKREDSSRIPPLSVNHLRLVLEPQNGERR
ncbi:hypothetical protein [Desulfofundulus thermosubterraneus]|uniref:Uncharacterized protein n=1 Tax=Desulfofundulus thermosubterraneus DSM 16057 TaxID=1121432 RepID=A0A1M6H2C0_9FIRM|nr:hypothetical protein [Desulfofundulus thermosubterraneus]SHJ16341.1 hypothetical protein SAMN02745219_01898 [Desulfofundulus thermosubterraneus DSM 16057]